MIDETRIEEKITQKMEASFSKAKNPREAVHATAVAGAAIVATLPVGTDAVALRIAEITMVILIARFYGEKLTKSAAKGFLLSSAAQAMGEFLALEVAEVLKIANPAVAYLVKSGIAVGIIEAVGHMTISFYENPQGNGAKICSITEAVGFGADVVRVAEFADNLAVDTTDSGRLEEVGGGEIPFTGGLGVTEMRKLDRNYYLSKAKEAEHEAEIFRKKGDFVKESQKRAEARNWRKRAEKLTK